jgi:RNA polymerase sigma-70 factor (ECF subfamily)
VEQRIAADLFERHHLALFRYIYHQTRRRDIAEDIVQDVFVRVVRSLTYQESGREAAWLFTIARRLLTDRQRARFRHPMDALPTQEPYTEGVQETSAALAEALACVPEADREAFLLKEIGGLTYVEIASVCEVTADSVRSRIYRARMRLRNALSAPLKVAP